MTTNNIALVLDIPRKEMHLRLHVLVAAGAVRVDGNRSPRRNWTRWSRATDTRAVPHGG